MILRINFAKATAGCAPHALRLGLRMPGSSFSLGPAAVPARSGLRIARLCAAGGSLAPGRGRASGGAASLGGDGQARAPDRSGGPARRMRREGAVAGTSCHVGGLP